jgi:hypothetical protein
LPRTALAGGLVKGVSRAQRGRSQAKIAKTLDEPEVSPKIRSVMARVSVSSVHRVVLLSEAARLADMRASPLVPHEAVLLHVVVSYRVV